MLWKVQKVFEAFIEEMLEAKDGTVYAKPKRKGKQGDLVVRGMLNFQIITEIIC